MTFNLTIDDGDEVQARLEPRGGRIALKPLSSFVPNAPVGKGHASGYALRNFPYEIEYEADVRTV
ncbi:hypothetical protein RZS08_34710, partial [Arthrospira platensis SPKY1]|nr:hypothetical protein [Arthrospira platensis SPKY1]